MRSFYGDRISANISRTPQGFLICSRVPVARTGWQTYAASEIGLDISKTGDYPVKVYRSPEEVFSPETIASGEGQTITDTHPPEFVNANNCSAYDRGHAQHVRRGEDLGDGTEALTADLFVTDASLISKIENGLREISCGYECTYEPLPEERGYAQKDIRINHIAVVPNGRAGELVRIRDHKPEIQEERKIAMPQSNTKKTESSGFLGLGRLIKRLAATDAEPEDFDQLISLHIQKATDSEEGKKEEPKAEPKPESKADSKKTKDEGEEGEKGEELHPRLKEACDAIMKMKDDQDELGKAQKEHMEFMRDSMEDLKDHLGMEKETSESNDSELIVVTPPADRPKDPTKLAGATDGATVDTMRQALLASKPFVAKSNDAAAIDRWNEAWKALPRAGKDAKQQGDGHAAFLKLQQPAATQRQAFDGAGNEKDDTAYFEKLSSVRESLLKGKVN